MIDWCFNGTSTQKGQFVEALVDRLHQRLAEASVDVGRNYYFLYLSRYIGWSNEI